MKKVFKVLGILLLFLIGFLTVLWFIGVNEREGAMALVINDINFTSLEDGVYYGYYEGGSLGYRENAVEVEIFDGRIISITNVINNEDKTDEFLNDLYGRVIEAQSLEIDSIASATLTCKAYLKAIEDALTTDSVEQDNN